MSIKHNTRQRSGLETKTSCTQAQTTVGPTQTAAYTLQLAQTERDSEHTAQLTITGD